ncbi:MAG: hypothetical protein NT013_15625 [Planctomycetia bacterium]|nr:hypothetical protein [Planctomycetia bacterium]
MLKHWAIGISGRDPNAFEAIRQGIVAWRAQGSELGSSYFYAMQAEVALSQDRLTDAAAALTQGDEFAKATAEGFPLSDLHRLRGEVAVRLNDSSAESHFLKAIEVARLQGSRSHELRSMVSLTRLLSSTSRAVEAHESLSMIVNQFDEGHDTLNIKEARALLPVTVTPLAKSGLLRKSL